MKYYKIISKPINDELAIPKETIYMFENEDEVKKTVQEYNDEQKDILLALKEEYSYVECNIEEYINQQQTELFKTTRRILMDKMLVEGGYSEEDKRNMLYGDYCKVLSNNLALDILNRLLDLKYDAEKDDITVSQFIDEMYKTYTTNNK